METTAYILILIQGIIGLMMVGDEDKPEGARMFGLIVSLAFISFSAIGLLGVGR